MLEIVASAASRPPASDDSKKTMGTREEIFLGFEPLMMIKRRVDKYTKYQKNISLDDDRGTSYYFLRGGPPEDYIRSTPRSLVQFAILPS